MMRERHADIPHPMRIAKDGQWQQTMDSGNRQFKILKSVIVLAQPFRSLRDLNSHSKSCRWTAVSRQMMMGIQSTRAHVFNSIAGFRLQAYIGQGGT